MNRGGRVSVIIPAYNEVRTLAGVIEVVRTWPNLRELIVVDDGSTDHTSASIAQFRNIIQTIVFVQNKGKAYAMAEGVRASTGEYVLFLDADLIGLTHLDLDHLVSPVIEGKADMTIGVRFMHRGGANRFKTIGGERSFKRADLLPILSEIRHLGYGIELYLNNHFKHKRITYVDMPYVSILVKYEKLSIPDGTISYIKEALDLVTEITRQHRDTLTPQVKRLYRMTIEYLKAALS